MMKKSEDRSSLKIDISTLEILPSSPLWWLWLISMAPSPTVIVWSSSNDLMVTGLSPRRLALTWNSWGDCWLSKDDLYLDLSPVIPLVSTGTVVHSDCCPILCHEQHSWPHLIIGTRIIVLEVPECALKTSMIMYRMAKFKFAESP